MAVLAGFAFWLHRSWKLVVAVVLPLLLVINLGYWENTVQTLTLILFSTVICIVVGVPVGIAAAHRPWLYNAIRPVLDLMQTIPTFVYLIPTMIMFGLGMVPGLISTVIFAIPAPIRLTHLGVSSVPRPLVEAGEAFGATRRQLLWKVELPHAMPTIMAGVTQCIMLSLSMGRDRGDGRRAGARRPGAARAQHGQHRQGVRGRARHRHRRHPARPHLQAAQ